MIMNRRKFLRWCCGIDGGLASTLEVITLAKALDITRFEVYESNLDEGYTTNRARRLLIKC
jgi:hypothetical protein